MKKANCWEYKNCGMDVANTCPAFTTHHGQSCWRVAGTMCGGKVQGVFAEKLDNCKKCNFYSYMKS